MTEMMTQRMRLKEMKNSCTLQSPVCYKKKENHCCRFIESGSGTSISSESGSGSNPNPGFWWPKNFLCPLHKLQEKLYLFLIKNCNLLMSKLQDKPSAFEREQLALKKMNFINFLLCLWVIFAFLNPNPDRESGSGYESRDPIECGSNPDDTDPDPQHGRTRLFLCQLKNWIW